MRYARLPVALATLVLFGTSCTPETDIVSTPRPAIQQVVDSAPYLCTFVPEHAFRLVSGVSGPLVEKTDGNESNGDCRAPETATRSLVVWWMQEGRGMPREQLDFLMDDRRKVYSSNGGVVLPTDLGDGMAAYLPDPLSDDQPYQVSAKFRCGTKDRLIDISLPQIAKGRDAIKDLTELMRVAQKRYGELYNCTPGA
jgi:hypothetical protein